MEIGTAVEVKRKNQPNVVARGVYRGLHAGIHRVGVHTNANNPNFVNVRSYAANNFEVLPASQEGGRRTRRRRSQSRRSRTRHRR
jgi:hypothetical protein